MESYEDLLYELKLEQYKYFHEYTRVGRGEMFLSQKQIQRLNELFKGRYNLEGKKAEEVTLFYTNALQGLINKAYLEYLAVRAHIILYGFEPSLRSDLKKEGVRELRNYIYHLNSSPRSLEDESVNAGRVHEELQGLRWPSNEVLQSKEYMESKRPEFCCVELHGSPNYCSNCPLNQKSLVRAR